MCVRSRAPLTCSGLRPALSVHARFPRHPLPKALSFSTYSTGTPARCSHDRLLAGALNATSPSATSLLWLNVIDLRPHILLRHDEALEYPDDPCSSPHRCLGAPQRPSSPARLQASSFPILVSIQNICIKKTSAALQPQFNLLAIGFIP
jgi:hypothetical protein